MTGGVNGYKTNNNSNADWSGCRIHNPECSRGRNPITLLVYPNVAFFTYIFSACNWRYHRMVFAWPCKKAKKVLILIGQ